MANVPKAQIKTKLAAVLKSKEEQIAIFGLKTKFGGGRTTGFATIYDSVDLRKKYDSKKMLRRVCQESFIHFPYFNIKYNRMVTLSEQRAAESKERKSRAES